MKKQTSMMFRKTDYQLTSTQRFIELARPWLLLVVYIWLSNTGLYLPAVAAAAVTCLAGFVQMHDAIHHSLGLSKRANSLVLTISGLLLLKSGHALKVTHLRHHGRCLSDQDPEGAPARWTLKEVFLRGPYHIFALRIAALRMSPNTRNIQLVEAAMTLVLLIGFVLLYTLTGSWTGLLYWAVAFALSSLMPLWASYIPHHLAHQNPVRLASVKTAGLWTPIVTSFAFHHLHHTYPQVPTALLPKAARELPEPDEEDDHFHP